MNCNESDSSMLMKADEASQSVHISVRRFAPEVLLGAKTFSGAQSAWHGCYT